jgi:hypothetical protein
MGGRHVVVGAFVRHRQAWMGSFIAFTAVAIAGVLPLVTGWTLRCLPQRSMKSHELRGALAEFRQRAHPPHVLAILGVRCREGVKA